MFIHKVDGLNDDTKMETQRDIHQRATDDMIEADLEQQVGWLIGWLADWFDESKDYVIQQNIHQRVTDDMIEADSWMVGWLVGFVIGWLVGLVSWFG